MTVRAENDRVLEGVKPPLRLGMAVVDVAARLVPLAALALVAVDSDCGLRPAVPRFIAMSPAADDVALAIVPRAGWPTLHLGAGFIKAATGLNRRPTGQAIRADRLLIAAVASAKPGNVSVRLASRYAYH